MINFLSGRVKLILAALVVLALAFVFFTRKDYVNRTEWLDSVLMEVLQDYGVSDSDYISGRQEKEKSGRYIFLKITRRYEVGRSFDFDKFRSEIDKRLRKTDFKIVRAVFEKEGKDEDRGLYLSFRDRIVYEISFLKKAGKRASRKTVNGAKIAIVLDDFGYNMHNVDELYALDTPITISVLPNLTYSRRIAEESSANSVEILLHLPLEPHGKGANLERGTIKVGMSPKQIRTLLNDAIESVPRIKGVSNHMGSRATEDEDLMRVIFDDLRKRHLYFLDSLVTDNSVCESVATKSGLRIAIRDVFLDNKSDEDYIENQLRCVADIAAKNGQAVGLGHDRPNTLRVLGRVIPELKGDGFQFVYLSELIK